MCLALMMKASWLWESRIHMKLLLGTLQNRAGTEVGVSGRIAAIRKSTDFHRLSSVDGTLYLTQKRVQYRHGRDYRTPIDRPAVAR
jgi:hypothetical protein